MQCMILNSICFTLALMEQYTSKFWLDILTTVSFQTFCRDILLITYCLLASLHVWMIHLHFILCYSWQITMCKLNNKCTNEPIYRISMSRIISSHLTFKLQWSTTSGSDSCWRLRLSGETFTPPSLTWTTISDASDFPDEQLTTNLLVRFWIVASCCLLWCQERSNSSVFPHYLKSVLKQKKTTLITHSAVLTIKPSSPLRCWKSSPSELQWSWWYQVK